MPLPDKEQFTGSSVTEQGFKQAQNQLIDYIDSEVATSEFVDSKIIKVEDKLISFERGVNIFDPTDGILGKYWNAENGKLTDGLAKFVASKLIPVTVGIELQVPPFYNQQFVYLGENKKFISGVTSVVVSNFKFTPPAGTKYIGFTLEQEWLSTFMVCESAKYPPSTNYVPFTLYKEELRAKPKQIIGLEKSVKYSMNVQVQNIIDTSNVIFGRYVEWNTGLELDQPASEPYCIAGFYSVKPSTEYQTSSFYDQQHCYYNENFEYIGGLATAVGKKFITPANAAYIRFSVKVADLNNLVVTESANFPSANTYVPYAMEIPTLKVSPDQILDLDKKIQEGAHLSDLNIINLANALEDHYVNFENGQIGSINGHYATDFLPVKPNTLYRADDIYNQQFSFSDVNKVYISGMASVPASRQFKTPSNAAYIRLTIPIDQLSTTMITEADVFPTSYKSYDVKTLVNVEVPSNAVTTTEIITSADVNDTSAAFTGKNSAQLAMNSISGATEKSRYVIKDHGFHKITVASEVIGYPSYPSMILMKDHVDLIGDGNTVYWLELPYNDEDIGPSANGTTYPRTSYQTLYSYADDSLVKGVTFVIVNARYALHLDNPIGANKTHRYENTNFISKGDKGSKQALGIGTSSGEKTYFVGGSAHSDGGIPLYLHNNSKFESHSVMSFKEFKFSSNTSKQIVRSESDGSLVKDQLEFIGCSFGGTAYVMEYGELWVKRNPAQNYDSFNHAEWQFSGYGNEPFLFDNQVRGYCLRLKTTTTGINNTIRFDKTSSAYPILIKNNQANADSSIYMNSREYIDGYIVQDGSVDIPAQAWGCKDLTETVEYSDGGVVYTSLAKRLGNCTTINKTLGVIVNGTTNTITFNKDYSNMTNAQIVAEINSQLSGVTADLYIYGREYYPTMTDVTETVFNTTSTFIPKGSVVAKSGGSVRLANGNDKIYGVALDDIPVQQTTVEGVKKGEGRVLKRGYIYTNRSKAHFVLADVTPAVGTTFRVENGQLVASVNGSIRVDIDSDVVSINC